VALQQLRLGEEGRRDGEALLVEAGRAAGDLGEVLLDAAGGCRVIGGAGALAAGALASAGAGTRVELVEERTERREPLLQHVDEDLLLAREVLVQRGLRAAGGAGDLLGGGTGEADGAHPFLGGVEDAFPGGAGGARRASGHSLTLAGESVAELVSEHLPTS
jgi:hypothetical protein